MNYMVTLSDHANFEMEMSKALDRMGDTAMQREDEEDDIGAAFQKFAVVTKELGALMKNMVSRFTYWNHYDPRSEKSLRRAEHENIWV